MSVDACRHSSGPVLPLLYQRRAYRPVWTSPEAVRQLLDAIRRSYDEGLDPEDYNLSEILELLQGNPTGTAADPSRAAFLDMLLTDAFVRLATNTLFGAEDPSIHHPQWRAEDATGAEALVDYFEKALAYPSLTRVTDSWKVRYDFFEKLKRALASYRAIRARGGWRRLSESAPLKPGDSGPGVWLLRRRLAAEYLAWASPRRTPSSTGSWTGRAPLPGQARPRAGRASPQGDPGGDEHPGGDAHQPDPHQPGAVQVGVQKPGRPLRHGGHRGLQRPRPEGRQDSVVRKGPGGPAVPRHARCSGRISLRRDQPDWTIRPPCATRTSCRK